MPDIADARADRPLQPGDVVRVVGQKLSWTVIEVFSSGCTVIVYNDARGTTGFPATCLERVK